MTSSCIKLKFLLLSPSETEKANIINFFYFWSRNEDILTCLKQRKGIVKSKHIDVDTNEASKFEALTQQQSIKTYSFTLVDAESTKRFEIKLVDDTKQCKEGSVKEIQSVLAKKNNMDGILLALKADGSEMQLKFEDIFPSSKDFEENKKRNPQLITLVNGRNIDLKSVENFQDKIFLHNEIFDVDPEILSSDAEKQQELRQMNKNTREILFEIFRKLWSNALIQYEDHQVKMKKRFIRRRFQIGSFPSSDKRNRVKRIKSLFILPSWGGGFKEQLKIMQLMKNYQPSLQKRVQLEIPGIPLKVSEAKMIRKVFAGLKSVQTLKFGWPNTTGSPPLCQKIVSRALGKLSLLKSFSLQYPLTLVSDKDLESIELSLKKLKRLECFSLTLPGYGSTKKEDLEDFQRGLKRLTSLKEVYINLNGAYNSMNQAKMTEICGGLSKFSHLKGLKLLMHGPRGIHEVEMKLLCDNLSLHTGLQRLFLDFSGTTMTNQEFQTFYQVLKKLPDLKSLTLLFVRSEKISHDDFKAFCQRLQELRSLEELNLNFSYCPELTRESLSCLRDTFQSLTGIHSASLLFVWCKKISFEDIEDLKKSLLELRPFKNLVVRR